MGLEEVLGVFLDMLSHFPKGGIDISATWGFGGVSGKVFSHVAHVSSWFCSRFVCWTHVALSLVGAGTRNTLNPKP